MLKIRCSSLGKIMTNPKKKTETLSVTCKSYIKELVKEDLFGYSEQLDTKAITKGIACEDDSITLYNTVNFKSYKKNTERLTNDFISGECDLKDDKKVIDIKSSWSLETFPAAPSDINSKIYEWQLVGYMWLYNLDEAELAYCMVSTPLDLLSDYDNLKIHLVDEIDSILRVTTTKFTRDKEKELLIAERVKACRLFYESYKQEILNK